MPAPSPSRAVHPPRPQDLPQRMTAADPPRASPGAPMPDADRLTILIDAQAARIAAEYKPDARSRSRRDGYEPNVATHVRRYLVQATTGATVTELAQRAEVCRSTVSRSIRRGQSLVESNRGFSNPDRRTESRR